MALGKSGLAKRASNLSLDFAVTVTCGPSGHLYRAETAHYATLGWGGVTRSGVYSDDGYMAKQSWVLPSCG